MLIEFTCSNHRSILKPVTFSFVASTDKTRKNQTYSYDGIHVLSSAIIYGANGSGKTNIIDALGFVKWFLLKCMTFPPNFFALQRPHKLAKKNADSKYAISFVKNNISYRYEFTLNSSGVKREVLYTYPNGRRRTVFDRKEDDLVKIGPSYKNGNFTAAIDALRKNRLFLACVSHLCNIKECFEARSFICDDLIFCLNSRQVMMIDYVDEQGRFLDQSWQDYSLRKMQESEEVKRQVLRLVHSMGHPLQNLNIFSKPLSAADVPPIFKEDVVSQMLNSGLHAMGAKVDWGKFSTDLISEESSGIKKMCWFLVPFLEAMQEGRILICDELDSHLHESVVRYLIEMINQHNDKKLFPQFLLTAHSSSLMTPDLFRRDQIWFTELREKDRSTDLYSLAEIKNVRVDASFRKGYISGRYGAIPILNYDFNLPTGEEGKR